MAGGIDLREATAARSLGGHAADRSGGPKSALPHRQSACVRCAATRRCGSSRGSPQEAAVVSNGGDLRAASAAAVACDAAADERGERRADNAAR